MISGTVRPLDFMFDSSVWFSGMVDRMDLLPDSPNPRWRPATILEISNDDISGTGRVVQSTSELD